MTTEFQDIADPTPHLPGMWVPWYLWVLLGLLGLAILSALLIIFLAWRRNSTPPSDVASIYEESREHLEALRKTIKDHPLAHVATEASLAVRRYLAACLSEPALFETHEEFVLRDDALSKLPAGARERVNPLLEHLANLKYSPSTTDPEIADTLLKKSLNALQGIESSRTKDIPA